jgi:FkbM family methyltransferase
MDLKIKKNLKKFIDYKNGFFIEAGGFDGLFQSNSLFYEQELNWKGILIEPNFQSYLKCLKNRPNSIVVNSALVDKEYSEKHSHVLIENNNGPMSRSFCNNFFNRYLRGNVAYTNTTTLTKLLNHFNINYIDLLSLDVEGNELNVLRGIDFDLINIKYISIEIWNWQKKNIFKFLKNNGFICVADLSEFNKVDFPTWPGNHNDYLFLRN